MRFLELGDSSPSTESGDSQQLPWPDTVLGVDVIALDLAVPYVVEQ